MVTKHASTGKQSSGCRSAQSFANRHISDNQPCPESRVSRSACGPLRGFRVCGPGSGVQVRGSRAGPWSGVWVRGGGPVSLWGPWSGLRSGISGRQSLIAVRPKMRVQGASRVAAPRSHGRGFGVLSCAGRGSRVPTLRLRLCRGPSWSTVPGVRVRGQRGMGVRGLGFRAQGGSVAVWGVGALGSGTVHCPEFV